jgi:hypothetical protein
LKRRPVNFDVGRQNHMKRNIAAAILFITCLGTSSAPAFRGAVVARFGGECEGSPFPSTPRLAGLIHRTKRRLRHEPCDSKFCDGAFSYDLNGDGRKEYFVRLTCGATGNCTWGIFSDHPARLLGVFDAQFFYIHQRNAAWSPLTTYTREGGDECIIATWRNRRRTYVLISERSERGSDGDCQPFLKRMGVPKCG